MEKIIHVVASISDGMIYLITAYIPDPDRWEADWKTRKEESREVHEMREGSV